MVNNHSYNPFLDGITLLNGDLLTGVINQLLSGMILQASMSCPLFSTVFLWCFRMSWSRGCFASHDVPGEPHHLDRHPAKPGGEVAVRPWKSLGSIDNTGWFGTFFIFPFIGFLIIPTEFHIFQRGSNHQPDHISVWNSWPDIQFSVDMNLGTNILHISLGNISYIYGN